MKLVWVFNGANAAFPSGVFSSEELARAWIERHQLSGVLTSYPVDISALEWAVEHGHFKPSKPKHSSPAFVQAFTSASQPHIHFCDGVPE